MLIVSNEDEVSSHPLGDDPGLQVKCLLPDEMSFDFAVNTMVYQPGAALSMVEMHVMEHGLIMLEGGGIYRLGDSWYPVTAGDFIWMAPWCPQWFGAIGKVAGKISHLQRLEPASAGGVLHAHESCNRSTIACFLKSKRSLRFPTPKPPP